MERIHSTVLDLLEKVGFADPTPGIIEVVSAAGGWISADGRLCYPRGLVEDVIANATRSFIWPGQSPEHDLDIDGHCIGKSLAFAYVTPEYAAPDGIFEIEILGEKRAAQVLTQPTYDPKNERLQL